jgi:hypothetical protein
VEIEENLFFFEEKRSQLETAFCPICGKPILNQDINGWLHVTVQNLGNGNKTEECTFPMP